jgi:exonuclease III
MQSGDYIVYCSAGTSAACSVAILVHKRTVRSAVKNTACNDRIIAIKLQVELVYIWIMQVYMPTSKYKYDKVEEMHDIMKKILEKDGKGVTNTIIMGHYNSVVGGTSD